MKGMGAYHAADFIPQSALSGRDREIFVFCCLRAGERNYFDDSATQVYEKFGISRSTWFRFTASLETLGLINRTHRHKQTTVISVNHQILDFYWDLAHPASQERTASTKLHPTVGRRGPGWVAEAQGDPLLSYSSHTSHKEGSHAEIGRYRPQNGSVCVCNPSWPRFDVSIGPSGGDRCKKCQLPLL